MCGRYVLAETGEDIRKRYHATMPLIEVEKRYNVAPTQMMPTVIRGSGKKPDNEIVTMRWGLIPHWAKEASTKYTMINARADTILGKVSFKRPFLNSRCLVPATGFYEWKTDENGKKIPYYIHLKDEELFSFAGFYETWHNPETDQDMQTYSIITTEPNDLMAKIHDRMPVILPKEDEEVWLDPTTSANELKVLLKSYPAKEMDAYAVSTVVNRAGHESPDLIKPVHAS